MTSHAHLARRGAAGLLVGLLLVGTVAYQAAALQTARRPAVVAVVNLQAVLEKLDQGAEARVSLTTLANNLKAEDAKFLADLKQLQGDLDKLPAGSARAALQDQYDQKRLRYQAWAAFNSDKLDIETALRLEDLYKSVKAALAQMAATGGYDPVLRNDSLGEIVARGDASVSREAQVLQQISERRLLYANTMLDITDELVARMNNEYKARGAKPQG